MKSLLIKNGRLLDPATGVETTGDLLIVDGRIAALATLPSPRSTPPASSLRRA